MRLFAFLLFLPACGDGSVYSTHIGAMGLAAAGDGLLYAQRREDLVERAGAGGESEITFSHTRWEWGALPLVDGPLALDVLAESDQYPLSAGRSFDFPLAVSASWWALVEAAVPDTFTGARAWQVATLAGSVGAILPDGCGAADMIPRDGPTAVVALRRLSGEVTLSQVGADGGVQTEVAAYGLGVEGDTCGPGAVVIGSAGEDVVVAASVDVDSFDVYRGPVDGSGVPEGPFDGWPVAVWGVGADSWRALAYRLGASDLTLVLVGPEGEITAAPPHALGCVAADGAGPIALVEDGRTPTVYSVVDDALVPTLLTEIDRVGGSTCAVTSSPALGAVAVWTEDLPGALGRNGHGTQLVGYRVGGSGSVTPIEPRSLTPTRLD